MVVDRTVKVPCSRGLEARMWLRKHPDTFVGRRACGAHVALNNQVFSNSPIFRQPSVDIVSAESGASQTVTFQNFSLLTGFSACMYRTHASSELASNLNHAGGFHC